MKEILKELKQIKREINYNQGQILVVLLIVIAILSITSGLTNIYVTIPLYFAIFVTIINSFSVLKVYIINKIKKDIEKEAKKWKVKK